VELVALDVGVERGSPKLAAQEAGSELAERSPDEIVEGAVGKFRGNPSCKDLVFPPFPVDLRLSIPNLTFMRQET
jgi:hypothetical protein